ncbi:hypothetical protein UFOVP967_49 [uncultured Caudovirales phage]|uniref:Uncharacterized protein n=1 Tax=uncultured Caudovirales phage TaxID=2100421 RepID=A0A6J5R3R8_9CAUD|nr:hypothetical protein UFOVP521_67 [uncultured Caudovirales phage]CAB4167601.1 hypothetical protein UFOVP856_39 [uncultured Caudovirales phage]CAB4174438.1 hypothetical protein UFOVP967_49 [uncultured Caudovirales phage]CAB4180459.1 hypothetical protein UFOVP1036_32 [uncultured Caudovirales phage]CAB4186224.1 hypothetical protein UFOVP1132_35 [uncultured Caudovirales phage]
MTELGTTFQTVDEEEQDEEYPSFCNFQTYGAYVFAKDLNLTPLWYAKLHSVSVVDRFNYSRFLKSEVMSQVRVRSSVLTELFGTQNSSTVSFVQALLELKDVNWYEISKELIQDFGLEGVSDVLSSSPEEDEAI